MATERGTPCPDCEGKEKTEYQALVTNTQGKMYSVGLLCYRKQWVKVYGKDEKCPV